MRRLWLHGLLLLLLIFAQQQAVAHQILHAAQHASQQQDPGRDNGKNCDKCLALAHLGDSVPATQVLFVGVHGPSASLAAAIAPSSRTTFHAYRSRAPPTLA